MSIEAALATGIILTIFGAVVIIWTIAAVKGGDNE